MGMDVSGKAPTTEAGKYFRNNCWWWRPLAHYCVEVAPEITKGCTYWQSNDGDGLNAEDSIKLAEVLKAEIASGRTAAYEAIRDAEINRLPDEPCIICGGTGRRGDPPNIGPGKMKCNGCEGKGRRRPNESSYTFNVANVEEWILFLEGCGGFEIY